MRLRERNADKLGNILHDNDLLGAYSLYDKKCLVVQMLPQARSEVELAATRESILLLVKVWDVVNFELSEMKEIFA
jgi:hypothetical protein